MLRLAASVELYNANRAGRSAMQGDYRPTSPDSKSNHQFLAIDGGRSIEKAKIADFRFHDLQHTFATRLVQSGIDLYTVAPGTQGHPDDPEICPSLSGESSGWSRGAG